ncbi:MAG TPA: sensor histidine kinase [Actinophytocola sp.]|uniref:sensor histidine kinase n=1 Tax=Actinophytocola sp. TaxID=1872138 RepID=UPI002DDD488E|nr:sensor histidine kinase [Actinophytocola sp.]HEV2782642.1 sensor histidine kinase [Actinophytocola sp.]
MPDDELPPPVVEIVNRLRRAHTDERRRIARDLHDQVGHALSVALNSLELHEVYLHSDPSRAQEQLRSAVRAVRRSHEAVRTLCSNLRRREVVDGLEDALREYLAAVTPPAIAWTVTVTGDDSRLPAETRDELFLILREAARNALVHSRARRVEIAVVIGPDAVLAGVSDDGAGFDLARHGRTGGLASMRERAALLGGSVAIASTPGTGTAVRVRIPLGEIPDHE